MFCYLRGVVTKIYPQYLCLENNGIGYRIQTPNNFQIPLLTEVTLYLSPHLRPDNFLLFGFLSMEQRDYFERLLTVTGVGPKSALSLLQDQDLASLTQAIDQGNASYLQKFPGIGLKAANQIILDLRGKLQALTIPADAAPVEDAVAAAINLGYNKAKVLASLSSIPDLKTLSTTQILKIICAKGNH
jgi:Holliday junction DNA helicase RuvA